jgi:hypothetical protein
MISRKNFSFEKISLLEEQLANGDIVEDCNLSQAVPGTQVCENFGQLTFRRCNLTNCAVPADSVIEDCNTFQVSKCSHLHPGLLEKGFIEECPAECDHVVDTEEVRIDGELVAIIYHRKDKVVI